MTKKIDSKDKNKTEKKESLPKTQKTKKPKVKKEKIVKKFEAKKLPSLFKKSYSQKKLDKKILSKLYVPEDKKYVSELFAETKDKKERQIFCIPASSQFTKPELLRLKTLAKEIKSNKGRFKFVPFIAVLCVIAALGITVTLFKNPVAKWGITSAMENIFGAKCDIANVNVEIFGSQITVKNLSQASKDDPFKNIFEFELLDLDFNLTELLRGRFDAQNIEITGIKTGTERKTSGKINKKQKISVEKEKKNDSTGFYASLQQKMNSNPEMAKTAFSDLFALYDPQKITENIKTNLTSPQVAKEVEEELKTIVASWKETPQKLSKSVEDVKTATAKLTSLNVSNVKTPQEVTNLLKEVDSAFTLVKQSKSEIESTLTSFEDDKNKVEQLKQKLASSIENDKKLLETQLSVFDIEKAKSLIEQTVNESAASLLGNFYPYLKQGITYATNIKASTSSNDDESKKVLKNAKETAKKESKRFSGRNVYFKKDTIPSFLIEKAHGSGNGIEIFASDISNDMNKRGKPWKINGTLISETKSHLADLTVDARNNTTLPLISANYEGKNFPFVYDVSKTVQFEGSPLLDGKTNIKAGITADSDYSFNANVQLNMNPVTITSTPLSNETAERIYSTALSTVKELNVNAEVGFSSSSLKLDVNTDFDRILSNALKVVAEKEFATVKEQSLAKINEELNSKMQGAKNYENEFASISQKLNNSKTSINDIQKNLELKKAELQKQASEKLKSSVTESATNAASSFLKGLKK